MIPEPMSFQRFFSLILTVLRNLEINYMVGGAVAVWSWGEPRSTQDIDIVIALPIHKIIPLSKELEKMEIYLPPDIITANLYETRVDLPLNAIHGASGFKAELFLQREGDDLRRAAFQRRVQVDYGNEIGEVYLHSPEDLILYKMLYYAISQQTKHVRDIGAILKVLGDRLDLAYVRKWAQELELTMLWQQILQEIDPSSSLE